MSDIDPRRVVLELAVEASGLGTFDWDLVTGELVWDQQLLDLFGYDEGSFSGTIESFNARVHLGDLPRVDGLLRQAIATCGEYEAEYRIVLPDGTNRWIAARGRALAEGGTEAVRLIGVAYDATACRDPEGRVARVLSSLGMAFFALDREWRFSFVNSEAERVLQRLREELLGAVLWDVFPAAIGSEFER
ncbi:MAG TPA: PAS domain-containing protein, partial [Acidimicrobiales bacterium]|nr:PAS domain-containing protein [Acidimicrobiales bacterium]